MTTLNPTLHQLLEEPANHITFWATSTDVICPAESPHAYKGTARHLHHSQVWDLVGSHCPRCNDDWGRAKDGLRPCLTRDCYTWKQTGKHTTPPPTSEEEIIFEEFEDDLHEEIANDIESLQVLQSVHVVTIPELSHPIIHNDDIEIDGKEYPYQEDGWSHCDVCDENKWDEDIEWAECAHEDGSRDWWMICSPCFNTHRASPNLNNLSSTGDSMSAPRITESIAPTLTPAPTLTSVSKAPTLSEAPTLTSQSTDTKNKEEQI